MDVLLTGATGFIGSHLRWRLSHTHRVYALARQDAPPKESGITWIRADLARPELMLSLPSRVDAIVAMAQSRDYREPNENRRDIFEVNIRSLMELLEYARQRGVKKFIFASSANVYKRSHTAITEDSAIELASFYARSKRIAEMLVESYSRFFQCFVLRLFTVFGPGQKGTLISSLIEKARQNQPIQVQGTQGLKLSPVYVSDVGLALHAVVEWDGGSPGFHVFNLGGDDGLGLHELGRLIGRVLGVTPWFEFVGGEEPGGWMADSSKLKTALGLGPFVPVEEGIRRAVYE